MPAAMNGRRARGTAAALVALVTLALPVTPRAGELLPNAQQVFLGQNGAALSLGLVYTYVPGTTTPKLTFQDPALTVPNTNPIVLDANGQARIWASGSFRQVVDDVNGVLVWDQVTTAPGNVSGPSASFAGGFAVWGDSTGQNLLDSTPNLTWIQTSGTYQMTLFGLDSVLAFNLPPPAAGVTAALLVQATGHGDGVSAKGQAAGSFLAGDDTTVTSLNKGELQGLNVSVKPLVTRNNTPFDDVANIELGNLGTVQARSAIFTGHSCVSPCTVDWIANLELAGPAVYGIIYETNMSVGIDFATSGPVIPVPIRLKNNTALFWRNAANSVDLGAIFVDSSNILRLGTGTSTVTVDTAGLLTPLVTTVGALPACSVPGKIAVVTDANGPTWHGALAGGGAVVSLALCTGTTWTAG